MESLITASVGLLTIENKFYLQLISARRYQFYYYELAPDAAELISNNEGIEIAEGFKLTTEHILRSPISQPLEKLPQITKPKKYTDTDDSFRKIRATKRICSIAEYQKTLQTDDHEDYYEGVEAVLLYHDNIPIFIIKATESWEYDPFTAANGRYTYFKFPEQIYESNDLASVEREMFSDILKYFNY